MDKASIGRKIREARQRLGLSQAEFADRIGTSAKTLSSWERGAYLVDIIMLNSIAAETGLTLNDFTDTPSSGTETPPVSKRRFTEAEKQLIEKIRCLRADKKKALYVFFGIREDK
ncbi:MAG: helix-turn-helix transcriptional regulator [Acidaminococcaceae bacterium]|nr:helix-turn-helix transcriptional regulator [Acidaminococcaceae bacterium]